MKRFKSSKNGPIIAHLFYDDDLMVFANFDENACRYIMKTLNAFCDMSGQ